ncbi:MAG: hypothetical protein Kow0092_08630 [Deferrisomatales bacterium]
MRCPTLSLLAAAFLALAGCAAAPRLHRGASHSPAGGEGPPCEACVTEAGHHRPELSPREAARRYRLRVVTDPARPVAGAPALVSAFVEDGAGRPVTTLQVHHERLAHFLVVSENLEEFHHVHAEDFGNLTDEARARGEFRFPVSFGMGGRYVMAVDFVDAGRAVHFQHVFQVEGPEQPPTRWRLSRRRAAGSLELRLNTMPPEVHEGVRAECNLALSEGGRPVTDLEPYLGVLTHLAIFRQGATASAHVHGGGEEFAHAHAHQATPGYRGPKLYFGYAFPTPGRYRIFAQFRRGGRVYTVPFDLEVAPRPVDSV